MPATDFYPIASKSYLEHICPMDLTRFVELLKRRIEGDEGLNPANLAEKAGLDNSTLRKLLNGQNKSPRFETAERICEALGTTVEEFLAEDPDQVRSEILALYNQLTELERQTLLAAARGLASQRQEAS